MRHQTPDAGFHIILVARDDGGHLLDVLGVLILNDVNDIVDGDDADEAALFIADGDGGQVVTAEIVGDSFLIVRGGGADDIGIHDIADAGAFRRDNQLAQGNLTDEPALIVDDVAGVDGLLVDARAADVIHRLAHGEIIVQIDIFNGHQASGAVFRIIEELVDGLARALVGVLQNLFDDVGGHFFQKVHRIIHEHIVHQRLQFGVGRAFGDELLLLAGHVGEHVGGDILGQHAEHAQHAPFVFDFLQPFGDIHRRTFRRLLLKLLELAFVQQLDHFHKFLADFFFHGGFLLFIFRRSALRKMQVCPKNGIKMRAATDRALPFYKSALCVNRKERRSLFPSFSGFARKATGIVVHVVHLRKYAGSCRSDGLRFRIPFEP